MTLGHTDHRDYDKTKLIITRGLPGSGKSTRAKAWVAEDPTRRARVNRDDLRSMVHDGAHLGENTERPIRKARDELIRTLLKWGISVVCDDTNLPNRTVRDLRRLATLAGADFEVWDMTDVPLDTCILRDGFRRPPRFGQQGGLVGEKVIRDMHSRYLRGKSHPLPLPEEPPHALNSLVPYVPRPDKLKAVIVDIDGTVALMCGRSPYDETRIHEDRPNKAVIDTVVALSHMPYSVIFVSGRTDACREATEKWLRMNLPCVHIEALHMRKAGDNRKDSLVKLELFNEHIRDHYDVVCVLDDRDQVVEMWRALGLTVLQVANGNF